jgi:hypothetical protein
VGILFGSIGFPNDAYATCVNYLQSQTIAAAYEGDEEPTVHTMDTCSGDDTSYQIPIATTVTFDGVEYSNIYATTNSVITFGQPDNTYWAYPNTPSISLYSMDWFAGINAAPNGLDILYSEGGFQINLQAIPFGQWNAQASNINILVAITNTGGIAVSYSYQGPEYQNLRTGVRLHDGSIVSLEAWGATQIQPGSATPTLAPEPIPSPTPTPTGPTEEQIAIQEEMRVTANLIANAIASLQNEPDPEPTPVQTEPTEPTPTPTPETTSEPEPTPTPEPSPTVEPSPEPSPQPTDIDPTPEPSPEPTPIEPSPEPSPLPSPEPSPDITTDPEIVVVEPEIVTPEDPRFPNEDIVIPVPDKTENSEVSEDMSRLLADLTSSQTLAILSPEQKAAVASTLGIKSSEIAVVAELAKSNEAVATALEEFGNRANENIEAPMPYTLADAVTEVQAEKLLEDPVGAIAAVFTDIDLEKITNPSEWGSDMTDDQREKVQEVIIPVILVSNIISSVMSTRRI